MRYLPPGSMRRQRWLGRLEGSIATLALVSLLGFGFIAATPTELYRPAPATYHPTLEGRPARIQSMPMPPCGPGKDCSELDDGADTMLPRFGPVPTPNTPHNTNQVPEPGTLTLIGVGAALMMRKAKRTTRQGEGK
jgi:hypothetical protein